MKKFIIALMMLNGIVFAEDVLKRGFIFGTQVEMAAELARVNAIGDFTIHSKYSGKPFTNAFTIIELVDIIYDEDEVPVSTNHFDIYYAKVKPSLWPALSDTAKSRLRSTKPEKP